MEERILNKLDKIEDRLDRIDVTLAKQHEQIAYHIKRTNLLEESLKPIQKHVSFMEACLKVGGGLAAVVAFAATVLKIVEFFR